MHRDIQKKKKNFFDVVFLCVYALPDTNTSSRLCLINHQKGERERGFYSHPEQVLKQARGTSASAVHQVHIDKNNRAVSMASSSAL